MVKKIIVPKAKRNIFINKSRFYLNIPELTFQIDLYSCYVSIVKDNIPHHVPLPNINKWGEVCLGTITEDYVDNFFCSFFFCPARMAYKATAYYSFGEYIMKYNKECICLEENPFGINEITNQAINTKTILNQKTLQFYLDNPIQREYW